jgi:hypothetical protein
MLLLGSALNMRPSGIFERPHVTLLPLHASALNFLAIRNSMTRVNLRLYRNDERAPGSMPASQATMAL